MIVLWRIERLRCVLVTHDDPLRHEVQVQRNGAAIVMQSCEGIDEAAELAGLLHHRFIGTSG